MAFEVITLNLIPSGDIPVIHAAQYDVDRPLKFALKLGSDDFNPSGYTLELQIRKVDNNIVTAAPSEVTSNVVTFNTTEQMCACSGTNLGEIQITKDDLDIATLHFYLVVQRDVLAGGLTSQSEIHDLADQIAEIVPEVIGDEYYTAAEVDEKIAEIPTFDPTNYYDKTKLYTKTETNGLLSQKANTSSLANVAFSGSYTDLINTPDIPDVSDYYTKEQTYSQSEVNTLLGQKADTSSLASVATSGDYDDLINKPTIPAAQVNSDWNSSSGVSEILNKPTLATVATSGDYTDLTNKPTVIQYGTELPMSTTDPDKVADRIEALENNFTLSGLNDTVITSPQAYQMLQFANIGGQLKIVNTSRNAIRHTTVSGTTDATGDILCSDLPLANYQILSAYKNRTISGQSAVGYCILGGNNQTHPYIHIIKSDNTSLASTAVTIEVYYVEI